MDEIAPLLDISAETRARRSEMEARTWVLYVPAILGGAALGIAIADSLWAQHLSTATRTGFYVAGGGLVVAGFVIGVAWDPVSGINIVYNDALAEKLQVPLEGAGRQ